MASEVAMKSDELKHLGFVKKAAIQSFVFVTNLYEFAKKNSGPLKPAVGTVESAVSTVVSPVFDKLKDVPDTFLGFADHKVDDVARKFDEVAPSTAKKLVNRANEVIQTVVDKAEKLVDEVQVHGAGAGFKYAATEYKQLLVSGTVKGWILLDQNSTFHKLGEFALPIASRWAVQYNYVIGELSGKGYTVFKFLPSVPVKEIQKAYEGEKNGDVPTSVNDGPTTNGDNAEDESDSD